MSVKIGNGFKEDIAIHSVLQNEKRLAILHLVADMKMREVLLTKENIIREYVKEFSADPFISFAKEGSLQDEQFKVTRQNINYHISELIKAGLMSGDNPYDVNERALQLANPDYISAKKKIATVIPYIAFMLLLFTSFVFVEAGFTIIMMCATLCIVAIYETIIIYNKAFFDYIKKFQSIAIGKKSFLQK